MFLAKLLVQYIYTVIRLNDEVHSNFTVQLQSSQVFIFNVTYVLWKYILYSPHVLYHME